MQSRTFVLSVAAIAIFIGVAAVALWSTSDEEKEETTPKHAELGQRVADALKTIGDINTKLERHKKVPWLKTAGESQSTATENLDILRSRLLQSTMTLNEAARAIAASRDAPERLLQVEQSLVLNEEKIAEYDEKFGLFDERVEMDSGIASDAMGHVTRVNQILTWLIEIGAPCRDDQVYMREVAKQFNLGHRYWIDYLTACLGSDSPDDAILKVALAAFKRAFKDAKPIYDRLNPVFIESKRVANVENSLSQRIPWCEKFLSSDEGKVARDANGREDLAALKAAKADLDGTFATLKKTAVDADSRFVIEARKLVDRISTATTAPYDRMRQAARTAGYKTLEK